MWRNWIQVAMATRGRERKIISTYSDSSIHSFLKKKNKTKMALWMFEWSRAGRFTTGIGLPHRDSLPVLCRARGGAVWEFSLCMQRVCGRKSVIRFSLSAWLDGVYTHRRTSYNIQWRPVIRMRTGSHSFCLWHNGLYEGLERKRGRYNIYFCFKKSNNFPEMTFLFWLYIGRLKCPVSLL